MKKKFFLSFCTNSRVSFSFFFSHYLVVTMFSEAAQSDTSEHASQSVPMVSTSTPGLVVPGTASSGEERDIFLEPDTDR